MRNDDPARRVAAFTLVELILVMALLCIILGLSAPSLSRSLRQRNLTQEGTRLLALTEYARDEAASQGVPMVVWVDAETRHFGVKPKTGYEGAGARSKEFQLNDDLHFDAVKGSIAAAGETDAAEFAPDGTLDPSSVAVLRLVDRSNSIITVAQTSDAWGYEIVKDAP